MSDSPIIPTLQTIADAAGVSRATVSLSLRNHWSISTTTRERIQKIAAGMGYSPNAMISALMTHVRSGRKAPNAGPIAFLTHFPKADGWQRFATFVRYHAGAAKRARLLGYRLEEMWMRAPGMTAQKMERILLNRGVEGLLVAPLPGSRGHLSMRLDHFASALLGYSVTRPELHRAAAHHADSLRLAVRTMRHLGYRRVALAVSEGQDRRNDYGWIGAYMEIQHFRSPADRIPLCSLDGLSATQLRKWLHKWKPDGIVTGGGATFKILAAAGVSVPGDLGVAILDRSPQDAGVAGIDQRPEDVGAAAVDLIVGQINRNERGIPENPKLVLTRGVWVMGESLRTPADAR